MKGNISRRYLLRLFAATVGLTGCAAAARKLSPELLAEGQGPVPDETLTPRSYLPSVRGPAAPVATPTATATARPTATATLAATSAPTSTATATPTATVQAGIGPKVVHVYGANATSWNFASGWYGSYVNQNTVNAMTDAGLQALTGKNSVTAAWQTLLPGYAPGKGIAIKVNFNNCNSCSDSDNVIDASIEPVNALVRGMLQMGVRAQDIWVYDAIRILPDRFRTRGLYPGVQFIGSASSCTTTATFTSSDPNAQARFNHAGVNPRRITDVVINASYLINMPIVKDHGMAPVTLGFKNHFGTIINPWGQGDDDLHLYIQPSLSHYSKSFNPLVDIYLNPHIRNKTVLVAGDCLFGSLGNNQMTPARWQNFGNKSPNSLFFATDPVAAESVMVDVLYAEPSYHPESNGVNDYMQLAADSGLGVFERADPQRGYRTINYQRINL